MDYILRTPRLGLRLWCDHDLDPFIAMNQDPLVMKYFPNPHTPEQTIQMVQKIHQKFDEHGYGMFATDDLSSGKFIGYIGLAPVTMNVSFAPCVEIGWRLRAEYWNKGLATEGAKACLEFGFTQLDLKEIYSFTSINNKPSERVMQKIGMEYQGEFDHPKIPLGHPICRHVLYKMQIESI